MSDKLRCALPDERTSMTDDALAAWETMVRDGMDKRHLIELLTDWARMLERRVSELDSNYRSYQWGKKP